MPRDLPLSNGRLYANFDFQYRLRDLTYPHVGQENQTDGLVNRFGVWVDGHFRWLDETWQIHRRYRPETLVTDVTARHPELMIELHFSDAIDHDLDVFLRKIEIRNLAEHEREVRLFFCLLTHMYGIAVADTAYYDPTTRAVLHYKRRRWFLLRGQSDGEPVGLAQFATGKAAIDGSWGTWQDAEDGWLSGNPNAQGIVDSASAIHCRVRGSGSHTVWFWLCVGNGYDHVRSIDDQVVAVGPSRLLERTAEYWRAWALWARSTVSRLPKDLQDAFINSLLILRTMVNWNGAILAAIDSDILQFGKDTYQYLWPRDGALIADAFIQAGYPEIPRRFFRFCQKVITPDGWFFHKYNPDRSPGSSWHPWFGEGKKQLPVQEDETALVVWAIRRYHDRFQDDAFIREIYEPLVKRAADWMVRYREVHGLPAPSYDLWEERRGVLTFTTCTTIAGLQAAARLAEELGEDHDAQRWSAAAGAMRDALLRILWRPELNRFARMVTFIGDGAAGGAQTEATQEHAVRPEAVARKAAEIGPAQPHEAPVDGLTPADVRNVEVQVDGVLDASLWGTFAFGALSPRDSHVMASMQAVEKGLRVHTDIGGYARYENDYYHQVSHDLSRVPGNPWFICTLWVAHWFLEVGRWDECLSLMRWTTTHALPSGVMAEQLHPYSGAPVSVSPLAWSHAQFISLCARANRIAECRERGEDRSCQMHPDEPAARPPGR